jgi:SAM-dependent methyltransferase
MRAQSGGRHSVGGVSDADSAWGIVRPAEKKRFDMMVRPDNPWHGAYKIPWDDPAFSARMLAEHLSQEHDMASRRAEWIGKQVAWIHDRLFDGQPASLLDLGCGPGFYSHRLSVRGHRCRGIDFGPASIEYARQHNADPAKCEFVLGDIRHAEFGGPYDLAMILYGELNVISPAEAVAILRRVRTSLAPQGKVIVEMQAPEAVQRVGCGDRSEEHLESGLFSSRPHCCRTEYQWLADLQVAVQTFRITDNDGQAQTYRNVTKAWSSSDLIGLLSDAGFGTPRRCAEWPCNTGDLELWIAEC